MQSVVLVAVILRLFTSDTDCLKFYLIWLDVNTDAILIFSFFKKFKQCNCSWIKAVQDDVISQPSWDIVTEWMKDMFPNFMSKKNTETRKTLKKLMRSYEGKPGNWIMMKFLDHGGNNREIKCLWDAHVMKPLC